MRIKRNDLKRLIENFINEEGTEPKGEIPELTPKESEQTEIGDTFSAAQTKMHGSKKDKRRLSRAPDADIQAVTDFRKGSDRSQFPPITFGPGVDKAGNLEQGKFTTVHDYRDPDPYDHSAVRRYKKNHFIGPGEKAAGDPEHTMISFDDEKTEESPYGTQYSLGDTDELYRYGDKTIEDPGYTADGDDDFYLAPEYEEGYKKPDYDDDTPPRTYGLDSDKKEEGLLSRLMKKFFGNS